MTSSVCSRLGSLLSLLFLAAVLGVTCETADFTSTRSYFRYFQTEARSVQNNCGAFDVSACTRFKILGASREGPGEGGLKFSVPTSFKPWMRSDVTLFFAQEEPRPVPLSSYRCLPPFFFSKRKFEPDAPNVPTREVE